MEKHLQELKKAAVEDYRRFCARLNASDIEKRVQDFADAFTFKKNKKYIKVINARSAWGFIVTEDDGKFRKGDILKAKSWSSPEKNHPRGNIIDGGYRVEWTSPLYLR